MSLIVCDVDNFKRVNDGFGHACGDAVLKTVANMIAARLRDLDTACRIGGEEFAIIVPGLDAIEASDAAEGLLRDVARVPIKLPEGGAVRVTVSAGVATIGPGESAESVMRRADAALYQAKRDGRDRARSAA